MNYEKFAISFILIHVIAVAITCEGFTFKLSSIKGRSQQTQHFAKSPQQIVTDHLSSTKNKNRNNNVPPLTQSILLAPTEYWSKDIIYKQLVTDSTLNGIQPIQDACTSFDMDFQSSTDHSITDASISIGRISSLATQEIVKVEWNITWIPPTALWLVGLANTFDVKTEYKTYNQLSGQVSTFRWEAVLDLFRDAFFKENGVLRIPLACIEGQSTLRFQSLRSNSSSSSNEWELCSIREELSYANELKRGKLLNRRCASDLRLFLESGRRITSSSWEEWEDIVANRLPWGTVPGSGVMDIEPMGDEEGLRGGPLPLSALIFLGIVTISLTLFANAIGPELVGQSLFGPTNYIVDPNELLE